MDFEKSLAKLQNAIFLAVKHNIDLKKELDTGRELYDFKEKQKSYHYNTLASSLKLVKRESLALPCLTNHDTANQHYVQEILELIPELENKELSKLEKTVRRLTAITRQLNFPKQDIKETFEMPKNIPAEIRSDIKADIHELSKCFNNECYRSSVILCGRLLETALHRKYYEVTENDLLEKSPGIGLGNIIAKLKEKNMKLDPALTNQIHLINQVRIFSVHKKKEAFCPSVQQTKAAILYTLDILEKLFC